MKSFIKLFIFLLLDQKVQIKQMIDSKFMSLSNDLNENQSMISLKFKISQNLSEVKAQIKAF